MLRASLLCDGRSQLDYLIRKTAELTDTEGFYGCPCRGGEPKGQDHHRTDAGLQNVCFRHIKSPGWDFIDLIRGNIRMRLNSKGEDCFRRQALQASSKSDYPGPGTLARSRCAV
ncbi:hypothetical protein [Cedecea colo]|uniref:hypothetical protein n=1 Tax=Cedecea colo TaxID=2552946 RepID=UPI003B83272A